MADVCQIILDDEGFNLDEIDGKAALFYAAKNDIEDIVETLSDAGLDLNITDDEGKTAMFYANEKRSMDVLCELIYRGARFKLDEIDGKAALFNAAQNDLPWVIPQLYDAGLDLNITDDEGKTAVFYANEKHTMDVLCELFGCGAHFKLDEIDGKAVLFYAAQNDLSWVIPQLYDAGLDLNITDDEGKTAMFYANEKRSMEALCELIHRGAHFKLDEIDGKAVLFYAAQNDLPWVIPQLYFKDLDLDVTDDEGKTAVFYANEKHTTDVLCELIYRGARFKLDEIDGKAALFNAAKNDIVNVVLALSDAGLDLNITDDEGKTAVFYANKKSSMDVLCELIYCGAHFKLGEIDGKAVLFYAAQNDVSWVIPQLYDAGLDLNITDDEGKTAVFYANEKRIRSMEALCELIYRGAHFKLDEIDGKAVLFYAAQNDLPWVIPQLYDAGLDLNITDDEGKTAVFYANEKHTMDVLCELFGCGAHFKLDEIDGKGALFNAAKNDMKDVVKPLYDAGLDLNITDDEGKTAVFYANKKSSMDVLCELIYCGAHFKLGEIDGKAVLFYAAQNDLSWVIPQLYFKDLDLDVTDDEGKTAVFYANEKHTMDVLCELIYRGARFKLDEIDGKAALFNAAKNDIVNVVLALSDAGLDLNITDDEGKTAVFYANKKSSMDVLCELIYCGAHFKLGEIDGKAVLFYAAQNDVSWVIPQLYDAGLDLNITDDEGKTAVFYANEKRIRSMEALCELIYRGAHFKLDEIDGKAVLFYAAQNDLPWVIPQLYDAGLDLNITDDEGKTAVFYANEKHTMDVLCELIGCGAHFKLDEIDGKGALFNAAKNDMKDVVKPLYDAGLDLNITDDEGKTAVFYAAVDFMDALIAVDKVLVINARDLSGRTPLFYALADYSVEKAQYLIEKGGNLQLKDRCNVSIFSFFIEKCISSQNVEERLQLFTSDLFQEQQQLKSFTLATLDIIYCQAPLLSVSGSHLPKSYMIFNKTDVLKALTFARAQYSNQDANKVEDIEKISSMINENEINVPCMLSLLNKLGANPISADSDGNTALHYATLLPLFGVTEEAVMNICKKLKELGTIFDVKNHQHQSPLQFCLSSDTWKVVAENNKWKSSIRGLVEVCRFLLSNGCSIDDTSQIGESVFHRIILLTKQGLELNDEASRKVVSQVVIDILKLLPSSKKAVRNVVNNTDNLLNTPLHLWASIELQLPRNYLSCMTEDHSFKDILQMILHHLKECGAKLNPRNANEETPLHLCRTWTAVKLLLDAGANPIDVDSSGRSPLLVAANKKTFSKKLNYFYPDVTDREDAETFWRNALKMRLDQWTVDKESESVLGVLIKSEEFILANALVEVACKDRYVTNDHKISFLNTICKDKSRHTHWKTILVEVILNSESKSHLSLDSALRLCCRNIVQFGMFDEKLNSFQQKRKHEPSNGDGQPSSKKRRKDEPSKNKEEKSNEEHVTYDSVHCKIAKQLCSYGGVDPSMKDSSGESCLDIAEACPLLKDLLEKRIEIDAMPILIPWTTVTDKYKGKLSKVARRQDCEMVDQIWFNRNPIGRGSFGSIFAGINEKDGREVAMKRIEKSRMPQAKNVEREIRHLTTLADCEQVVRYLSFFEDKDFSYIFLELMEGNLVEYPNGTTTKATQATPLCKDVVMGLMFLHERKILHRDLKPQNILYKTHPKLCLKIADFGLSRITDSVSTRGYGTHAGTRCWMARELLVSSEKHSKPSDMFSCGLILHYILSGQKHPFNPTDWAKKNELQVAHETDENIINSNMEGWDNTLSPEATHLVKRMLESDQGNRRSAEEALEHPLFWSNEKKVDFLKAVGNQKEFEHSRLSHDVKKKLQKNFYTIVKGRNWWGYKHMSAIGRGMTRTGGGRTYYNTSSAVELVRFIRNVYEHYKEKTFKFDTPVTTIEQLLFNDFVFLEYFPDLVIEVYKAVTTYRWDKERYDINFAMNKTY